MGFYLILINQPRKAEQATQREMKILDASYKKADLQAVIDTCTHLNSAEKDKLLELLKKGHWRTKPVSF
jgi:hypothetical protein